MKADYRLAGLALAFSLFLTMTGCNRQDTVTNDTVKIQADAMYNELLTVYKVYADSLNLLPANDTLASANDFSGVLESKIYEIYKRYPKNLDEHLTEAQNDTLWQYASKFIEMRRVFDNRARQDSVALPTDSIDI